jgi:hypothetical protein
MRDVNRIPEFLAKVGEIWIKNCPDWRFGQLLTNFIDEDPFYWEEDKFLEKLEKYFSKGNK